MSDLTSLIEQFRVATEGSRELDEAMALHFGWTLQKMRGDRHPYWREPGETRGWARGGIPLWSRDLSAIVALVEKRMPGWRIEIRCDALSSNSWRTVMWNNDLSTRESIVGVIGEGSAPLACSIALLLAMQSEAPQCLIHP